MINYQHGLSDNYVQNVPNNQLNSELIERYAPLVKYIAGRIALGLPNQIDIDDLFSYGILGLADALLKYDANRGAKFETYASIRIKGAIFDGLRKMDWIPHNVRARAKEVEKTIAQLEVTLERTPEPVEIAAALDISLEDYYKTLDEIRAINLISLEESLSNESENDARVIDLLDDPQAQQGFDEIERQEVQKILTSAIELLPEKEKLVTSLYYYEELTLKEIAAVLNLSESRISQLHTQAILRLRGRLSRAKKKLF